MNDQNYKHASFGVDDSGDKKELTVDESTNELLINILATSTTPSLGSIEIDENYEAVSFAVDGSENPQPLLTDENARVYIDTTNITVS